MLILVSKGFVVRLKKDFSSQVGMIVLFMPEVVVRQVDAVELSNSQHGDRSRTAYVFGMRGCILVFLGLKPCQLVPMSLALYCLALHLVLRSWSNIAAATDPRCAAKVGDEDGNGMHWHVPARPVTIPLDC